MRIAKHLSLVLLPFLAFCNVVIDPVTKPTTTPPVTKAPAVERIVDKAPNEEVANKDQCEETGETNWMTGYLDYDHMGYYPENILMGTEAGHDRRLGMDLSVLAGGKHRLEIPVFDTSHVCLYDVDLESDALVFHGLLGCRNSVLVRDGVTYADCGYCPVPGTLALGPNHADIRYAIERTCHTMKITSPETHQSMTYTAQ